MFFRKEATVHSLLSALRKHLLDGLFYQVNTNLLCLTCVASLSIRFEVYSPVDQGIPPVIVAYDILL